ncbi:MAG: histidine phosphatase family protein [Bacteroidales bacterium]|nr:histidine phosphatase family protein [Clostridium sp.]MCM1203167.1 histidine phosphatase family protein [Bacteroidales bacterium]
MEIYIVRHGQTVWNASNLLQGSVDIELNEKGRALAGETGQNLENTAFDKIYSSPLIRAYETACLIRGHRNIPIIRDERLRELNFGVNEGKNIKELLADTTDPFHHFFRHPELYRAPERGETLEHICERAAEFMREIIEPQAEETERVMIVAHGAINKAVMCHVKQHGISQYWSGGLQKNCNVIIVNLDADGYRVIEETKLFYEEKG